ncbi:MAG: outer membrane protein assembly factor BamE [Firmicutes bacterium]|nr:outer membrane protein assembly factor BamE [Bacillota bacterium]
MEFKSDDFKLIPNALFNRVDKGTNQTDLIAVTKKGIFVIEMKDYKGWIFGDENHKQWTQSLNSGWGRSKQYKFRNPIKQNENHIKTLRSILSEKGYDDLPIYNVIVFGEEAVLKSIKASVDVIKLYDIDKVFNKYRDIVITTEEINKVYEFLNDENIKNIKRREGHLDYIKEIKGEKNKERKSIKSDEDNIENNTDSYKSRSSSRYKEEWSIFSFIYNHKKLIIISLLLIITFTVNNGWMLLGSVVVGILGIKFGNGRAVGGAILVAFLFFISNPFSNTADVDINNNGSTNSYQKPNINQGEEKNQVTDDKVALSENNNMINLGVKKDLVRNALGDPKKISKYGNDVRWYYSSIGYVSFDNKEKVNGWKNSHGVLDKGMRKREKNAKPIEIDSSKEEVIKALGSAEEIRPGRTNKWYYRFGYVSFDSEGLVNGWNNSNGILDKGMYKPEADAKPIEIGSTKEEVLKALGSPDKISPNNNKKWQYGYSYITFDNNELVIDLKERHNEFTGKVVK